MYYNRNNLIIGFHGCDLSIRNSLLVRPSVIHKSEKPYDWLGHGIYFWENNLERAEQWAKDKANRGEIEKPAVIGAVLALDYCADFLDSKFINMIREYYDLMVESYKILGIKIPENKDIKEDLFTDKIIRHLDCTVIEFMHQKIREQIEADQTAKGFSDFKLFD